MSSNENSIDYSTSLNDNSIFVKLLSKYRIIMQRAGSNVTRKKQEAARIALTKEFNAKCHTRLTVKQILRKLNNIKNRLKEKNCKNLTRSKQLLYTEWERVFLDLWTGNNILIRKPMFPRIKSDIENNFPEDTQEFIPRFPEDSTMHSESNFSETSSRTDQILPEDKGNTRTLKFEKDYDTLDIGPTRITTPEVTVISGQQKQNSPQVEVDEKYKNMSLDDLKRAVLISQMKTLKAQEDAARAKEKLSLAKLALLPKTVVKEI